VATISTHVIDTTFGAAATGVSVVLEVRRGTDRWEEIARGVTDSAGRIARLGDADTIERGVYRLTFAAGDYLERRGQRDPLFPSIPLVFAVRDAAAHYHLPLLLGPHTYTTYRGT